MLTKCPECELQISDKALACPHCGLPLQSKKKTSQSKSTKRMRLPNGFGQISEIKDTNMRNRFRAMVSVGKDSNGKPIVKSLKPVTYFATYNDAYTALVEYNKNPYDLSEGMTVKEVYEKWSKEYFKGLKSDTSERTITSAWKYCHPLYKLYIRDIKARHLKGCIENASANINGKEKKASPNTKMRMKSVFNLLFDYALEYDLVDKNYARTFNISDDVIMESEKVKRNHLAFSDAEMELLWSNTDFPYVDVLLIQCYSGWRPQELGLLKLENINLEKGIMVGGMKTKAGTNRIVPIHPKIRPFVEAKYQEAKQLQSEYLFNCTEDITHKGNWKLTYDKYQYRFAKICERFKLNSDHRPHDGRKHFVTMAKKNEVDEYAIKYIIGHQIDDLTENTYTERHLDWLISEMQKIK